MAFSHSSRRMFSMYTSFRLVAFEKLFPEKERVDDKNLILLSEFAPDTIFSPI